MSVLNGRGRGDLVARVLVETPTRMSAKQKKLLEEFRETETGDECPAAKSFFAPRAGDVRLAGRSSARRSPAASRIVWANNSAAAWSSKHGSRGVRLSQRNSPLDAVDGEGNAQARTRYRAPQTSQLFGIVGDRNSAALDGASSALRGNSATGSASISAMIVGRSPSTPQLAANAPRLLSTRCAAAHKRHAVVAGERAHPPCATVEQSLAVACREPGDQAADAPETFAEAPVRRDRLEQHSAIAELEGDVDEVAVVGQPDAVGAGDARSCR